MSNTIRRPRKRPRVTSVNFRTLGWLIRREAAAAVWFGPRRAHAHQHELHQFMQYTTTALKARTEWILLHHPERRYYP